MGVVDSPTQSIGVVGAYFAKTQLSEWVPADIAGQLPSQHRHIWVGLNGTNSNEGSSWQATCRDCLCHCRLTASSSGAEHSCIDQDGHHFHGSFSSLPNSLGECSGSTRCCKCGLCVTGTLRAPVLMPEVVQSLERARLLLHSHHPTQGTRDLVGTISTLYKMTKNACNGDIRPIKTDSEKPRKLLKFDPPCIRLLEEGLGFQLRLQTEYHPPADPGVRLERVRDELALISGRLQRKLPESERVAGFLLEYEGERLLRWLGAHAYGRRQQQAGLAILAGSGTAVDDAYRRLGVPEDASDAVVAWAYRRQVEEDPETGGPLAQRRYDCLSTISAVRTSSDELLGLVDSERDRGLVASAAVHAACAALFGDALLDISAVDSDTLREVFLARLNDTHKTEARMELAAHLAILACAKRDQRLEDYAAEVKLGIETQVVEKINTWVQLPIGLANIGNTCYLNCMLQCLFSILPIRNAVLRFGDKVTWNEACELGRRDSGRVLTEDEVRTALKFVALLRTLFESLVDKRVEAWSATLASRPSGGHPLAVGSPRFPVVTPDRELADMLLTTPSGQSSSLQRSGFQQQDVDECMAQCVSLLNHALPPSSDNSSWIEQLLAGHLEITTTEGSSPTKEPPTKEAFVNLSLNLPTAASADINECLEAFFAPTEVTSDSRVRSSRILDAPPVLCIQVQRVQFDMAKMQAFKINSHLRLRSQISLTRFRGFDRGGDSRLEELRMKLESIDRRLATLALPAGNDCDVLGALDRVQSFMDGVGRWAELDAAQQLLADLPQTPDFVMETARNISLQTQSLSSVLGDSKRQWDLERRETASEINGIYEAVEVDSMAYTLHAVFIHSGMTPEFGHYWIYVRDYDRGQRAVRWLKFNDSYVTVVDESEIFNTSGVEEAANPYYLVYARTLDVDGIVDLGV
ncbi:ubiquitin-specific protease ubp2 [Coemansia sp. RSA 2337]|nr:ubiquitin-specific protease ubp2 [Coemansia sp. S3946]KAJ2045431.1 ubiquitin-specific protease ubp2 [Coemansia sp. S16]KAJ2052610.1 ubiquitin-specific protease ubp2 [Coemansia sp. S2]KAJ2113031.1 ubiquitin-specific protease ubp2 [Coemansia sp. RSA 922]KAJ2343530.1 ubiquitin-specific protease ubp2 [Coemansia sp. RSA 2673]KAJ2464873.1 ubiquitin-specific protease ubp2 [Coemansia sp. RSA 2337]